MPTDSLQLYYPLSLQSLDGSGHIPTSTRHLVNSMSRSISSGPVGSLSATVGHHGHSPYALESSYGAHSRLSYGGSHGGSLHPSSHHSSHSSSNGYMTVPMTASSSMSSQYLSSQTHQQQSLYSNSTQTSSPYMHSPSGSSGRVLTPHHDDGGSHSSGASRYTYPEPAQHPHSSSPQPGSGYGTPQ